MLSVPCLPPGTASRSVQLRWVRGRPWQETGGRRALSPGYLLGSSPAGSRRWLSIRQGHGAHHHDLSHSAPHVGSGSSSYQPRAQPAPSTTGGGLSAAPGAPPVPGEQTHACWPSINACQTDGPATESRSGAVTCWPCDWWPHRPVVTTPHGQRWAQLVAPAGPNSGICGKLLELTGLRSFSSRWGSHCRLH